MKWILIVAGVLLTLAVLVWIAGSLLPRTHRAASRIVLGQAIDTVWAVVRNPGALKGTWPELTEVARQADRDGREVWTEKVGGFDMTLIVAEATPPERLVMEIDSPPGAAFGGRWVYELARDPSGGTVVTVAEEGWIGPPPFRVMSRVMGYHRNLDQYLGALGRHFGQAATPVHVP